MQYLHKKIDYTVPSGHEGGPGSGKQITPYVGTPYVNMTAAQWLATHQAIGACLGDTWSLGGPASALGGNAFMFVRANEALALGQLVAPRPPTNTVDDNGGAASTVVTGAGTAVSPTTTTAVVTTDIDNTSYPVPVGVNEDVDNWLYVASAAGIAAGVVQLRRIKANSSSTTSFYTVAQADFMRPNSHVDADVFDYTPLNTEPCSIIRPYHVVVNNSQTYLGGAPIITSPIGVALGTVTAGNYTIIQIRGLASVQSVGNAVALAPNIPCVGSNDGVIIGTAADNLYNSGSNILPQIAQAAAGPIIIPCYVNFTAQ